MVMVMVISTKNSQYSPTGPGQAMLDISIEMEGLAEISGFEQSGVQTESDTPDIFHCKSTLNTNLRNST